MGFVQGQCIRERYVVSRQLGGGGMGVVYEALDRATGRQVALKTMRAPAGDALLRFKREFRLLQDLHHPNLVALGELMEEAGEWCFSMELVRGTNFLAYVRGGAANAVESGVGSAPTELGRVGVPSALDPLAQTVRPSQVGGSYDNSPAAPGLQPQVISLKAFDESRLRAAMNQLVDGLHALHTAQKVHRDIKPDNVLVTAEGRVVILDFGLIGEAAAPESAVLGTVAYMAPEQAAGRRTGPAADWYSLGVLLYEAMTGCLPYTGTALEILAEKQKRSARSPSEMTLSVDPALESLCLDLLAINPEQRPDYYNIVNRLKSQDVEPAVIDFSGSFFVGRASELTSLMDVFLGDREGHGRTILLHGESGVGKSALMRNFATRAAEQHPDVLVLHGRCYEHEAVPFKAVDGLIDSLARIVRKWSGAAAASLLPRRIAELLQAFPVLRLVPAFAESPASKAAIAMDPHEQRQRVFAALRELLARLAERQPLLLLIDDLQWTDADSLTLLSRIMSPPDEPSLMLVATVRPNAAVLRGTWLDPDGSTESVQHIPVGALPGADAVALAERLAGETGRIASGRLQHLVTEAGGHPLFIQELVRYVANHSDGTTPRLEETLWNRVATLPASARQLLTLAAVMGSPLRIAVAIQASELDPDTVERAVIQLRSMNLLRASLHTREQDGTAGDRRAVEPYHDRVRELVSGRLSVSDRQSCHQKLAAAILASPKADPELLCYHLSGSGDLERAGAYAIQAGDKAAETLAFARAAGYYEQALAWLELGLEAKRELLCKLARAHAHAGRGKLAAQAYLSAAGLHSGSSARRLRMDAASQLLRSGHMDEGHEVLDGVLRELGIAAPHSPTLIIGSVIMHRARLAFRSPAVVLPADKRDSEATERADACREASAGYMPINRLRSIYFQCLLFDFAVKSGDPERLVHACVLTMVLYALKGGRKNRERAEMIMSESKRIAELSNVPYLNGIIDLFSAIHFLVKGNFLHAHSLLSNAEKIFLEQCQGIHYELTMVRMHRMINDQISGNFRESLDMIPRYLEDATMRNDYHLLSQLYTEVWPRALLVSGQAERSLKVVQEEESRLLGRPSGGDHGLLLLTRMRANIFLYVGKYKEAYQQIQRPISASSRFYLRNSILHRALETEAKGRCALAAALHSSGAEREHLLQEASRHAALCDNEEDAWIKSLALLLRAGILAARGRREEASNLYLQAQAALTAAELALQAAAARYRYGQLQGALKGQSERELAEKLLVERRIKEPRRWIAMLSPAEELE